MKLILITLFFIIYQITQANVAPTCGAGCIIKASTNFIAIDIDGTANVNANGQGQPTVRWDEARDYCTNIGSTLASITSQAEQNEVADLIDHEAADGFAKQYFWIGANPYGFVFDDATRSVQSSSTSWGVWQDGSSWGYTNWKPSEPYNHNNYGGTRCVYMHNVDDYWNDVWCGDHPWAVGGILCNRGCSNSDDCGDNASCDLSDEVGVCKCDSGFSGDPSAGKVCQEIDECADDLDNCSDNAFCTNVIGGDPGFTCTCVGGYEDINGDGTDCQDINECTDGTSDCGDAQVCYNTVGSYICCDSGFEESNGECVNINECNEDIDDCIDIAECVDHQPGFECVCPEFYSGDGKEYGSGCDENECLSGAHNCASNANCEDTIGSFQCSCPIGLFGDALASGSGCQCPNGYSLSGDTSCVDDDECELGTHSCNGNGQICINTAGGHECEDSYFGFYVSYLNGGTANVPITTTLTLGCIGSSGYDPSGCTSYTCSMTPSQSGTLYSCTFSEATVGTPSTGSTYPWNGVRFTNNDNDGAYIYRLVVHDAINGIDWDVDESWCLGDYYGYTVGWYPSTSSRYNNQCEHYSDFGWNSYDYFDSGAIWVDGDQCRYSAIDVYLWLGIYDEVKVWPRTAGYCSSAIADIGNFESDGGQSLTDGNNDNNDNEWKINLTSTEVMGFGGLLSIILCLNIICMYINCNGERRRRNKGYGVVGYDSEEFDESEANAINIVSE